VQFVSYSEAIDTGTRLGTAIFTIIGAVTCLERDLIRERVRAAKCTRQGQTPRKASSRCGRDESCRSARYRRFLAGGLAGDGVGIATLYRLGVSS
jgi:DNA invertase Pin-like site-specific DNA recombinase